MIASALVSAALAVLPPNVEPPTPVAAPPSGGAGPAAPAQPFCAGEYAEDMSALQTRARDFEEHQPAYTFCIRTTAVYECPFYGSDGDLRRVRKRVVAHGTGFAYRRQDGGTLLLTNDHVAEWPVATDEAHPVESVPAGCRRVSDALKIVDGEDDRYEPDDIPLTRVVADPQLDVAVLKSSGALPVMPWKIGHSAALRERDVVNVRGFPLGVMKADNVGKVVSAFDHDDYKDWDHDDFVVDALLSPGNSGSPVFAVSCKTGEFELVGIYHAAYSGGSALNVVVGIDQVRDLMTTLRRAPKPRADAAAAQAAGRSTLVSAASSALDPFFPFGSLVAAVRARPDGALYFEVYPSGYPVESWPLIVVEDLPAKEPEAFGPLGRLWIGNRVGLKPFARGDLDAEAQGQLSRILDALRYDATTAFRYRAAVAAGRDSKERFREAERLEKTLRRSIEAHGYLSEAVAELSDRLGPGAGDRTVTVADLLVPPAATSLRPVDATTSAARIAVLPPASPTASRGGTPEKGGGPGSARDER